jgi:3-hydroxypropanoate dehydrogenase
MAGSALSTSCGRRDYRDCWRTGNEVTALHNGSLQGAYLILAARSLGLAAGPMSGFNPQRANDEFFAQSTWRANFLVNIGHADQSTPKPRAPRVRFEDAERTL